MTDRSTNNMPRTEEQYEAIRGVRRNQILEAALELFADKGYFTTSISQIAAKAGISKGLMYNYFQGKEDLILAIIWEGISKITENFDPNRDGYLTEDEFEFFVNESFRILQDNSDYWKLYFATLMQPAVFNLMSAKYAEILPKLTGVIRDYYQRKGAEDPETEALLFGATLDGISMNFLMNPESFPLEKMKSLIIKRFK